MAGTTRYLRFIVFAFLVLILLFFISSSSPSSVPGGARIKSTTDILRQQSSRWRGSTSGSTAGKGPAGANVPEGTVPGGAVPGGYGTEDLVPGAGGQTSLAHTGDRNDDLRKTTSPNPFTGGRPSLSKTKNPSDRANATFVTLARNGDVWEISRSIRQVEDRFNRDYNYDWVFLNDDDFDDTFKKVTTSLTSGRARYGKISSDHWGFPSFIDQDRAAKVRDEMREKKIIYGDSISYRHMCRYESGFFFRHPLMLEYEYYWRVEPSIELYCDISYDPFKMMQEKGKKYSFVLSLYEYLETIPTLWDSVKTFMKQYPHHIAENNSMAFLSDDGGATYNNCHFWSNFEIGNLDWLRSDAYIDYFNHLDHDGGFFYERWGDAPVHSIAAALMLKKDEIHFFNDIAYYHVPFTHCPKDEKTRLDLRCHCNPDDNFDWNGYSCTSRYFEVNGMEKPPGSEPT